MCQRLLLAVLASCLVGSPLIAADDPSQLVEQLNSSRFVVRQKAYKQLQAVGEPALKALQKAAAGHSNREVRKMAAQLAAEISQRVDAARFMQARRFDLDYRNVPLADVLSDLRKKFGCELVLKDSDKTLASRRVTLVLQNAAFWEAFDRLCVQPGLVPVEMRNDARVLGIYLGEAGIGRCGDTSSDPITLQKGN